VRVDTEPDPALMDLILRRIHGRPPA
jgi:hypothetical protein